MNRSKKSISPREDIPEMKYTFSNSFNVKFDALIKAYSDSLESLTKMNNGKIDCDYGVCASEYHTRYLTPKNISSFVDNLLRAIEGGFFHDNVNDINMFIVASVIKFFEENGCEPIDDDATRSEEGDTINPQARNLIDLEMICTNDMGPIAVYSKGEITQRIKLASEDIKKITEMHFAANMKKVVSALPKIINDACVYSAGMMKAIFKAIEDFVLFATTVNICTVLQMYAYCNPATDYTFKKEKKEDSDEENVVTECCMCKTNDYMIRNRIPFNCNMRDVILQDVTPDFKDTHDALHFILKDTRSPICLLVNKNATKEGIREIHGGNIARMFLGVNRCHEHCLDDVFAKDGERKDGDPLDDVAGFQTKVDWLDNIAFGNNYLDGNYRRDALGNNHFHPITNSLDAIFKMYSGIDLKSNEELANNILSVAGAIKDIIREYNCGKPIENYELTKDVLVLLGEILTRNMLRLYYNNTHVIKYTDDMFNAAAPGFIGESFVMEADASGNDQGSKETENQYKGVEFKDGNGNTIKPTNTNGIKALLAKIADWFKRIFRNWGKTSEEKLKAYIEAVKNNTEKNKAIGEKLDNKSFRATLKDYMRWNVDGKKFTFTNNIEYIDRYIGTNESGGDKDITFEKLVLLMLGVDPNKFNEILTSENTGGDKADWKDITNKLNEYYYFTSTNPSDRTYTGDMTSKEWNEVIGDITGVIQAIDLVVEAFAKKGDDIKKKLDAKLNEQNLKENVKQRIDSASKAYQKAYTDIARSIAMYLSKPFFSQRYALYTAVVKAYDNQQSSNNNTTSTTAGVAETQTTETKEEGKE